MKRLLILALLLISFAVAATAFAAEGYPWNDNARPFNFLFENHIDSHQQSNLIGNSQLTGFFYIKFTGGQEEGLPTAMHADCSKTPADCVVGWQLQGVAVTATRVANEGSGHPTWCINPEDMPQAPGYTHFHWEGEPEHAHEVPVGSSREGYVLKLTAVDHFYFQHHGGFAVTPGIDYETHDNVLTDC